MMKRIKLLAVTVALLLGMPMLAGTASIAAADTPTSVVCNTLGGGNDCTKQPNDGVSLDKTLTATINILSMVVGIIAVFMIIVSGIKFITANGDSGNVKSARQTLTYALVGVVVVLAAQALVQFVLHRVTH